MLKIRSKNFKIIKKNGKNKINKQRRNQQIGSRLKTNPIQLKMTLNFKLTIILEHIYVVFAKFTIQIFNLL